MTQTVTNGAIWRCGTGLTARANAAVPGVARSLGQIYRTTATDIRLATSSLYQRRTETFDQSSILFADVVDFTSRVARMHPAVAVGLLSDVFGTFDALAASRGLETTKTNGDGYMVAAGVPGRRADHADALAGLALDMVKAAYNLKDVFGNPITLRIGISSGPVVAGVIGATGRAYDVWGDTVNVASRMESQGLPDCIQVAEPARALLSDRFVCRRRGMIDVRGWGRMRTWFLVGRRGDVDPAGARG